MYNSSVIAFILLFVSCALGADVSSADDEGVPVCVNDRRTVSNIVWSCLATIFASTWLAIHPNVPGRKIRDKGAISRAVERAKVMGIAILAPEVIVSWAAEQFKVAWKVCHGKDISVASVIHDWRQGKSKDLQGLTMTHGFFFAMGGFCYTCVSYTQGGLTHCMGVSANHSPDISVTPVEVHWVSEYVTTLEWLCMEPLLAKDLEQINVTTIEDKSKGDALSKTISIIQISWFIAQCVARIIQHLPITLLEMTALAFAGISIITYSLWWYKPLNAQYHISLDGPNAKKYLEALKLKELRKLRNSQSDFSEAELRMPIMPLQNHCSMATVIYWLKWFLKGVMTTVLSMESGMEDARDTEEGPFRFSSGRGSPGGIGGVPNETWARFVVTVGVGSLFGAFHCVAWSFYFPSHAEMLLWRFSSLAVLIGLLAASHLPGYYLIRSDNALRWAYFLSAQRRRTNWIWNARAFVELILTVISCIGTIAYIVGRMTLVILAFMQLRSLPPLAFHTVQWTTYIPHI
ncbi:hypothetical protein EV421DRAFT_1742517 [Armillaria borealis]|uniref:Uncharacterized protein n=1 Tax=Armillaria borealis TaxID=47425 RepID=A0AA39IZ03_9AGAR|nr:hypothetical protein EV421DRAFT_1742517 [Armillaria borealis]